MNRKTILQALGYVTGGVFCIWISASVGFSYGEDHGYVTRMFEDREYDQKKQDNFDHFFMDEVAKMNRMCKS